MISPCYDDCMGRGNKMASCSVPKGACKTEPHMVSLDAFQVGCPCLRWGLTSEQEEECVGVGAGEGEGQEGLGEGWGKPGPWTSSPLTLKTLIPHVRSSS